MEKIKEIIKNLTQKQKIVIVIIATILFINIIMMEKKIL
jgi:flagellar biosynthesis/type III secretory pathway M-ring protein FliF/YscJ